MATYTTNLKDWGASGSEYPDGYNYEDDVPPVDLYDNFLTSNLIDDVQHLIGLTNERIEADKGGSGGEPTSPETSHLYHDQGNERLEVWDSSVSSWRGLLYSDGDTMAGTLSMGGYGLNDVGDITDDDGNTVYDISAGHVPVGQIEQGSGSTLNADLLDGKEADELGAGASDNGSEVVAPATNFNFGSALDVTNDGDGTVTIDAITSDDTHTAISEDGSQTIASVDDINFQGFLNVIDDGDGTVSLDPTHNHDGRYLKPADASTLDVDKVDGWDKADIQNWVNSNADVPNADYADSAGDADTLDGNHAGDFLYDHQYDPEADTHSRYSDNEARSAVDNSNVSVGYADDAGDADTVDGAHKSEIGLGSHDNSDHTTNYLPESDYTEPFILEGTESGLEQGDTFFVTIPKEYKGFNIYTAVYGGNNYIGIADEGVWVPTEGWDLRHRNVVNDRIGITPWAGADEEIRIDYGDNTTGSIDYKIVAF